MLQQTRVETVVAYFDRWMRRFPTVKDLAAASEQEVLTIWEGLGYYSRARNLRKAAKILMNQYSGQLPRDPRLLRKLPGIGQYTVGAIASIAFGLDEPALDGNSRRVLSRVFDVRAPADSSAGAGILWRLAAEHLPTGWAGDYNQALMDLGATICLPKKPCCPACPLKALCQARKLGVQERRPVLKRKKEGPHYVQAAAVIVRAGRVLLAKRPSKGLLGGLWEFPNGRVRGDPAGGLAQAIRRAYRLRVRRGEALAVLRHAYTHFSVTVHAFRCELVSTSKDKRLKWVRVAALEDYPMGRIDRRIARQLQSTT
jgi:A/G-specific adenine glycosylase